MKKLASLLLAFLATSIIWSQESVDNLQSAELIINNKVNNQPFNHIPFSKSDLTLKSDGIVNYKGHGKKRASSTNPKKQHSLVQQ